MLFDVKILDEFGEIRPLDLELAGRLGVVPSVTVKGATDELPFKEVDTVLEALALIAFRVGPFVAVKKLTPRRFASPSKYCLTSFFSWISNGSDHDHW